MDAQLMLEKIAKLEKAICHSQDVLLLKEQQQQSATATMTDMATTIAAAAAEVENGKRNCWPCNANWCRLVLVPVPWPDASATPCCTSSGSSSSSIRTASMGTSTTSN